MYPQDRIEREGLTNLQSARLTATLEHLRASTTPYWQAKLDGVADITSVADIHALPFTEKKEFREAYPTAMVAVPMERVVRVHASSGTSGKPTIVAYSAGDIAVFGEVNARAMSLAGATREDIVQVAYGYGLFTGGLGLHYGVEALGATAIPASGGNPGFQVHLMADLGVTGLCATPSFTVILAERAIAEGVKDRINLRWGVHGAEPWTNELREKIEELWGGGYNACDIYGLSEVIGPGVAAECVEGKGSLHVFEDHFYPEIVDPDTGDPVPEGEQGELVLTSLSKEAQPVIRYRTRDITRFNPEPCACGRTLRRIDRLAGRADDMLIIRGINVYPTTIESVILEDPALGGHFYLIVDKRGTLPELHARVEVRDEADLVHADSIAHRLQAKLMEVVRLRVNIEILRPGALPRNELGKTKRVWEQTTDEDPIG